MNRRAWVGVGLAVLVAVGAVSRSGRDAAQTVSPAPPVKIPFQFVNKHIVLDVTIGDSRPLAFLLDTGDKYAVVDLDLAKELGLSLAGEVGVQGVGTKTAAGAFVRDATFSVAGLPGFTQPVKLATPLKQMAPRLGHDFDGILGADFIEQFVLELDYPARTIVLHDKDRFVYSGPGESIPVRLNSSGHPIVAATVTPIGGEPIHGKVSLDIGSSGSLALFSPCVAAHHLPGPNTKTIQAPYSGGAGGRASGRLGRVSKLEFGKLALHDPFTLFSEDKTGAYANSEIQGNVGAQILTRFKLFFDYSHDRIILEPDSTFADPFDHSWSGLGLSAEGKDYRTFRIMEVMEASPGSEVGLQANDVILAIDDRAASDTTLTEVLEMFERPVTRQLTVRRGDETLRVTLTPRPLL